MSLNLKSMEDILTHNFSMPHGVVEDREWEKQKA